MKEETTTTDGIIASVKHLIIEQPKRCFVNVYGDNSDYKGRAIGDEYETFEEARANVDHFGNTYIETVEIIRKP